MRQAGGRTVCTKSCIVQQHAQEGTTGNGFTDNDSLAKELAHELHADLLVLLTNVDGLLDGPPGARGSKCAPALIPNP